jgi:hypothetical protein
MTILNAILNLMYPILPGASLSEELSPPILVCCAFEFARRFVRAEPLILPVH